MKKVTNLTKTKNNLNVSLEDTYDEALKDETFKEIVCKLKMKREELINYTSTLEECAKEYKNCQGCPGLMACKNKIDGYAFLPRISEGNLEFAYRPCKYQKQLAKKNSYQKYTYAYSVPKEISEASFSKIYKNDKKRHETIAWLTNFMATYSQNKEQKGLYIYGDFGSGKTYLISAMFNELAKDKIESAIVFWPEYLKDLKLAFNSEYKNEFNEKYNKIKKVPLLLIDDLGAETVTPWNRDEILCPILQYRMDEKLPTFFTSNLNLEALETHLAITNKGDEIIKAGRIISRIKQLTEYQELISKNLRK